MEGKWTVQVDAAGIWADVFDANDICVGQLWKGAAKQAIDAVNSREPLTRALRHARGCVNSIVLTDPDARLVITEIDTALALAEPDDDPYGTQRR